MKKIIFLIILFPATILISAENDKISEFNQNRNSINMYAMTVLGSWAIANIGISGYRYYNSTGKTKYFHQMNAAWNFVNLSIAGLGYFGAANPETGLSIQKTISEQHNIETLLLVNGALDAAYIMTGFFLKERGLRKSSNRLKGYGNSLILQGGFLLAFDAVLYYIHHNHSTELGKILENINFSANYISLTIKL